MYLLPKVLGSSRLVGALKLVDEVLKRDAMGNENCGEACLNVLDERLCDSPTVFTNRRSLLKKLASPSFETSRSWHLIIVE